MKIAVIAAAGHLGGLIVTEAIDRGHDVTAFINHSPCRDERAQSIQKSLFDLVPADVAGFDVILSAYGSGFGAEPELNRRALAHLAELVKGTDIRVIAIAGSGCLFTDESKTTRVYELPMHPEFLRGISMNTTLGVQDMLAAADAHCTAVCPGLCFDGDGPRTGQYLTDCSVTVQKNRDGESYTTYSDMACAMLDMAEQGLFDHAFVNVLSAAGKPGPAVY